MLSTITTPIFQIIQTPQWLPRVLRRFDNQTALLKDGTAVRLRQICSCDAKLICEIYTNMSANSRFLRFNTHLTDALCTEFAQQTAVQCEESGFGLLAYVLDDSREDGIRPLGFAYYVQHGDQLPEFAMSIVDNCQRLGLGKILLKQLLKRAKKASVTFLEAYVLPQNTGMRMLIQRVGRPFFYGEEGSYETYRIVV
ncbi:GNAT family N-acetyltransferase [Candidatus Leptofilum sp.]|uniref:GNAT family N-acetyltransferase n=1 Tax=Candidatus Leptofilum sp. TaxID=3241576 RepID=UPI003B5C2AB2